MINFKKFICRIVGHNFSTSQNYDLYVCDRCGKVLKIEAPVGEGRFTNRCRDYRSTR